MTVRWLTTTTALLLAISIGCAPPEPDERQAVFLIVVDTLRPDRLSGYGYDEHATPRIDSLASAGVRFDRAWSVASWTIPSMASMMTSLYPTQLGLVETPAAPGRTFQWQELRDQARMVIDADEITLADRFRKAGFRTAAFVNQPGLIESGNYFNGFEDAYFPNGVGSVTRYDPETLEHPKWPPFLRHAWANDAALIEQFGEWLGNTADEDLFVWLHLLTPHWPYDPPASHMPNGETAETEEQQLEARFYNGEVRATDDLVGRILTAIDDRLDLDKVTVVFTSDHGEALGERGMHDHGHTLHTEVTRVPLILRSPDLPAGRVVADDVRTIDLFPTLLELSGLGDSVPEHVEGTSLLATIEGSTHSALPVYAEGMLYGSTERSLLQDGFKLLYDEQAPHYRLFDVAADPGETADVAARYPERTEGLRGALNRTHGRLAADRARRAPDDDPTSQEEAERMQQALRSLGYVD